MHAEQCPGATPAHRPVRPHDAPGSRRSRRAVVQLVVTRCGELEGPNGTVPFAPGAEDVDFHGRDLWTVSESGAKPYLDPDEPVVPMLLRLDRRAVLAGSSTARC